MSIKTEGKRWLGILLLPLVALVLLVLPVSAKAAEHPGEEKPQQGAVALPEGAEPNVTQAGGELETVETTSTMVLMDTDVMDIPSYDGSVVGRLDAGQDVDVYKTGVAGGWNAVIIGSQILYIPAEAAALSAPYAYEYMSDLTHLTGYTGAQLEKAVAGTGLEGLGECYARMERKYGVNALFLIGIAKLESAGGTSSLARNSNNLGGLKRGSNGYMSFDTKEDCVDYMAQLLSEKYLTEGGRCYKGTTSRDVSILYCEQSASWYAQVERLMEDAYYTVIA